MTPSARRHWTSPSHQKVCSYMLLRRECLGVVFGWKPNQMLGHCGASTSQANSILRSYTANLPFVQGTQLQASVGEWEANLCDQHGKQARARSATSIIVPWTRRI